ncbi:hypothetical protein [uncultured Clostridium sp.]|jgi:hypothetical protein|uniref:hypothetical protein n=1 Tax=uncultured Clostridium sp. TaxID=59620 RepID=UPI00260F9357|nr:hypothetical protein [uncultured Clostridium sp.]
MKKLIIGGIIAIIVASGIGVVAALFSNSASSNNSNALDNMNSQNSNSIGNNTSSNGQSSNNDSSTQNNTTSNNNDNTQSSNNNINTNTTQSTFKMNLGNGKFDDLIQATSFLYGEVSNGARLVVNIGSTIVNNQLCGTEYYLNKPSEKFNVKISSVGDEKYAIYEFYNGVHTGTYIINGASGTIPATYAHAGSNKTINATFYSNNIEARHEFQLHGLMDNYPFYGGEVAGTQITWINTNNGNFEEYYNGDTNAFKIAQDENYSYQGEYSAAYTETYNGKKTGEYLLNYSSSTNEHTGKYIKYSNGVAGVSYNVTIKGSEKPTY